jgi:hypothetical protein
MQVAPAVEVTTFLLGQIRGLATSLGHSAAQALGLQVSLSNSLLNILVS